MTENNYGPTSLTQVGPNVMITSLLGMNTKSKWCVFFVQCKSRYRDK